MLSITIPSMRGWNEDTCEFVDVKGATLQLEHSLVSISKWESKWNKPFLVNAEKTDEEVIDYIRCMTITQNVSPLIYSMIDRKNINKIVEYINLPMTATKIKDHGKGSMSRIVTSEIIYYWMFALNIPMECQKWHLNRLLTLIQVCNIENSPKKKMSQKDIYSRNAAINAANRKRFNTKG